MSGGDDDLNRRPSPSDAGGKFEAIHRAGHVDVRKDDPDVRATFKDHHGSIRILGFDHLVTGVLDYNDGDAPDDRLILDHQDHRLLM